MGRIFLVQQTESGTVGSVSDLPGLGVELRGLNTSGDLHYCRVSQPPHAWILVRGTAEREDILAFANAHGLRVWKGVQYTAGEPAVMSEARRVSLLEGVGTIRWGVEDVDCEGGVSERLEIQLAHNAGQHLFVARVTSR